MSLFKVNCTQIFKSYMGNKNKTREIFYLPHDDKIFKNIDVKVIRRYSLSIVSQAKNTIAETEIRIMVSKENDSLCNAIRLDQNYKID